MKHPFHAHLTPDILHIVNQPGGATYLLNEHEPSHDLKDELLVDSLIHLCWIVGSQDLHVLVITNTAFKRVAL